VWQLSSTTAARGLLNTQRVWHGASQHRYLDRVKRARKSHTIHYKINDDVCDFHPVLYATLIIMEPYINS